MDKPTRYYSDKQEEFVAFYMNGKRCPNSGAGIGFFIAIVCSLWYFKKAYNEKQANNYIKKICNC